MLRRFIDSIETGTFEDFEYVKDLSVFKVLLSMTNMTLHNFKMDVDTSFLKLNDTAPYLQLFISNFSMVFTFDFDFRTQPDFILDKGKGYINIEPTSLYLGYDIKSERGRPFFQTQTAIMNSTDITIVMNGTADFSRVIFQLATYLKAFVRDKINDYLVQIVDATVTPVINSSIASVYNITYNFRDDIIANFTSTVNPAFTENDMTLFFKGEVRPIDEKILPFRDQLQVPSAVNPNGRQLQIVISDYLFNSTIYSLYRRNYLEIDTKTFNGTSTPVPASFLFYIFPTLSSKLRPEDPIWFRAVAKDTHYLPYIEIVDGVTSAFIDFDIEMRSDNEVLLLMSSNVKLNVNVYIVQGFKLTVDVQLLKIQLREIKTNNIDPNLDERDISSFIGLISGFARNYVNQFVRNLEIKLPIGDNISLRDVKLEGRNHYIYADVSPEFNMFTFDNE